MSQLDYNNHLFPHLFSTSICLILIYYNFVTICVIFYLAYFDVAVEFFYIFFKIFIYQFHIMIMKFSELILLQRY